MLKKILLNKIVHIIFAISSISIIILYFYLPKVTEQNVINLVTENSKTTVQQMKLTRGYYVKEIVGDIKKYAPNIKFDYIHEGIDGKLAFPTSLLHDLSDRFSENTGTTIKLYSKYPFKPKENRQLTPTQIEALDYIEKDENSIWIKRDNIDGKEVLRVAVPDYMDQQACVKCHNSHPDKTWGDKLWRVGDKRGVLEVITPIDNALQANNEMKNTVLYIIVISTLILVAVYSIFLVRREKELLDANELLDAKVKEEVEKNLEQERQLSIQSRSAAMGDMMAAIIHQWKQPLNAINMANSSLELQAQLDEIDKDYVLGKVQDTKQQINNMTQTMEDFRNFFKPQDTQKFNVNSCINDVLKMIGKIYENHKINIDLKLNSQKEIYAYPNELSQVFINILNNARDIIEENNCKIRTIFIETYDDEDNVVITIKDCAGGIPEDIIEKIFDPYFTTKEQNKGTGIGLDMSKNIINKINGILTVQNTSTEFNDKNCKGACFKIEIPLKV